MIIETVEVIGSSTRNEELGRSLRSLLGPMRVEEGCVDCHLFQDPAKANSYRLEVYWKTEDDLMRHVRSESYKKLLVLMEMGVEPPVVQFHEVSHTRGLEFVRAVRQR